MRVPFPTIWLTMIRFVIVTVGFLSLYYAFFLSPFDYRNKNVMNHKHTYEASNEVNSRRASIAQFMIFSSFNVTNKIQKHRIVYKTVFLYTCEHWACVGVCACIYVAAPYTPNECMRAHCLLLMRYTETRGTWWFFISWAIKFEFYVHFHRLSIDGAGIEGEECRR